MREATGDLWTYPADAVCVTTNGVIKTNGELVMGAGVALQAAKRFPMLPALAGAKVKARGNNVYVFNAGCDDCVITFPTKHHWKDPADLKLIVASAQRLVKAVNHYGIDRIAMTRPGCGLGGLAWSDVKPLLAPILDDRFVVLTPGRSMP